VVILFFYCTFRFHQGHPKESAKTINLVLFLFLCIQNKKQPYSFLKKDIYTSSEFQEGLSFFFSKKMKKPPLILPICENSLF